MKEIPPAAITNVSDFIDLLYSIANLIFTVFIILAVIFILMAAFKYLTASAKPEEIKKAHTMLIYAAVAVAVAVLAPGIVNIIEAFASKP